MKRLIAAIIVFMFMLPAALPWLPDGIVNALHLQQEAHLFSEESHHHEPGEHHPFPVSDRDHPAHFDVVTYFDNLHIDIKLSPLAKLSISAASSYDMPCIMAENQFTFALLSSSPKKSQAPPLDDTIIVSSRVPVYLATQRIRI
jgi:hypothetical protein